MAGNAIRDVTLGISSQEAKVGVVKTGEVIQTAGTAAKSKLITRQYEAKATAIKSQNIVVDILKTAKSTSGKPNQMEAILSDGTKIIFRRDIGEYAHPIGKKYPTPVAHYVEIHVPSSLRPGKLSLRKMCTLL